MRHRITCFGSTASAALSTSNLSPSFVTVKSAIILSEKGITVWHHLTHECSRICSYVLHIPISKELLLLPECTTLSNRILQGKSMRLCAFALVSFVSCFILIGFVF